MADGSVVRTRLVVAIAVLSVIGILAFNAVVVWEWRSGQPYTYSYWLESSVGALAFVVVGVVLTVRVPGNAIGPIMLVLPVVSAIQGIGGTAALAGAAHAWPRTAVALFGGMFAMGQVVAVGCVAVLLLIAPDGRTTSRRWHRVAVVLVTLVVLGVVAQGLSGPTYDPTGKPENDALPGYPDGVALVPDGVRDVLQLLAYVVLSGVLACIALGVVSLVQRYRNSDAEGRRRSGWAIAGAIAVPLVIVVAIPFPPVTLYGGDVVWATAALLFPLGIAIAVLRHGLYDLDRVVSRTVAYAVVTSVVVLVYAVIVTVSSALVGSQSGLVVAGATLAAAALFRPLLTRVQRVVDRRFNREKVDGQRAVEQFGAGLVDEVDPARAESELLGVTSSVLSPRSVALWTPRAAR